MSQQAVKENFKNIDETVIKDTKEYKQLGITNVLLWNKDI